MRKSSCQTSKFSWHTTKYYFLHDKVFLSYDKLFFVMWPCYKILFVAQSRDYVMCDNFHYHTTEFYNHVTLPYDHTIETILSYKKTIYHVTLWHVCMALLSCCVTILNCNLIGKLIYTFFGLNQSSFILPLPCCRTEVLRTIGMRMATVAKRTTKEHVAGMCVNKEVSHRGREILLKRGSHNNTRMQMMFNNHSSKIKYITNPLSHIYLS